MSDSADQEAQRQLNQDDLFLMVTREYLKGHIDVYPFALQMLNMVLKAAKEANSCGGAEPKAMYDLHDIIRRYVRDNDPPSVGFFDKGIYESPR